MAEKWPHNIRQLEQETEEEDGLGYEPARHCIKRAKSRLRLKLHAAAGMMGCAKNMLKCHEGYEYGLIEHIPIQLSLDCVEARIVMAPVSATSTSYTCQFHPLL